MRHLRSSVALLFLSICAFFALADTPNQATPYWAYCVNPPSTGAVKAEGNGPRHVPGSDAAFTRDQTNDPFNIADWHPTAHPPMPEVVVHGRKPEIYACAYCHLPNGQGHPESASLAGLSASYIISQMADFKNGARKSSEPTFKPATNMTDREWKASDQEIVAAANYFSRLEREPWIRVVETNTVPKTHVSGWMLVPDAPPATELIGQRIIETPGNVERTELRDDASGFVAYVPEGSIKRGKFLATGGDGIVQPCAKCHGPGLRGAGNVPPISGRSPSYMFRQLYDFKSGARHGVTGQQMRKEAEKLSLDDMIALSAFVSSLRP
jgi:cytochrome c553